MKRSAQPFIPPSAFDSEMEQRDTVVSGQNLEEIILSRAVVRAETGRKRNLSKTTPMTRPPIVVDLPGDVVNMDTGFFGDPNPFANRETARFGIDQFQTDRIFPGPTYYYNVIGNNGNEAYVFEGVDITPMTVEPVPEIQYVGFPWEQKLAPAYNFASSQNQFSAFVPPTPIPGSPVAPPNPQAFILPSPEKAQIPNRLF